MKADEVALQKTPAQPAAQKILQKKERRSKVDPLQEALKDPEREAHDSFEKFYNKDLDLEEGKWVQTFKPVAMC